MREILLSENREFMARQIINSVDIIETYSGNKELFFTAVQNALLSLVVLPFESVKIKDKQRIWPDKFNCVQKDIGFNIIVFEPIQKCENNILKMDRHDMYSFIRKFRNAIAHQNIKIVFKEGRIDSIEFFNRFPKCSKCRKPDCKINNLIMAKGGVEDFRISFTQAQLYKFSSMLQMLISKVSQVKALRKTEKMRQSGFAERRFL